MYGGCCLHGVAGGCYGGYDWLLLVVVGYGEDKNPPLMFIGGWVVGCWVWVGGCFGCSGAWGGHTE